MPYINGFIMAIRSLIQTFASFLGYKMPDSTGIIDDVLAGYGDEMDNFGSSVDDTNESLGGTAEKLKEIEGQLASFDKLNVIQQPTDNASGGSGGGGAGGGFGGIDSRLLDALNNMNYKFQEADMFANKIRDRLLEWADILGDKINDNIFEPIQNSWDKYGESIFDNFSSGFNNLKILALDFIDTWSLNWKPNFQAITDLFFSLLDTASLVFDTITEFMLDVWMFGGKDLFNSISRLSKAFMDLAKVVNDDFVKPLIKWFKKDILPVISLVAGGVLKLSSVVIDFFADLIQRISQSKPLVVGLTTAVVAFFASWKIYQFSQIVTAGGGVTNMLTNMFNKITSGNGIIASLFNVIKGGPALFSAINTALLGVTDGLGITNTLMMAASSTSGILSSALSFLAMNPLVAVVAGLGLAAGAYVALTDSTNKSNDASVERAERLEAEITKNKELQEEISKSADEIEASNKRTKEQVLETNAEYNLAEQYLDRLINLTGTNGYAGNIQEAKIYAEKINQLLPDSVEITEEGLVVWKNTTEEIKNQIEQLRKKAIVEAYEKDYIEALGKRLEISRQMEVADRNRSDAQKAYNDKLKEMTETLDGVGNAQYRLNADYELGIDYAVDLVDALNQANKTYDEAERKYYANAEAISNYTNAMQYANGTAEESVVALANLGLSLDDTRDKNGDISYSYDSLVGSLIGYNNMLDESSVMYASLSEADRAEAQKTRDVVIESIVAKGNANNQTLAEMLEAIKKSGVDISAEEEKQITDAYNRQNKNKDNMLSVKEQQKVDLINLLKQQGIEEGSQEYENHLNRLSECQEHGEKEGADYISQMQKGIADNSYKPKNEVTGILGVLSRLVESTNPIMKILTDYDQTSLFNTKEAIKKGIANIGFGFSGVVSGITGGIKLVPYATGGFPSFGEMFVARENGPELVGRVGNNSVVANNDQVADVILGAMERKGLLGSGNTKITVEVPVVIDKREVAKLKKEIELDEFLKTGKKK